MVKLRSVGKLVSRLNHSLTELASFQTSSLGKFVFPAICVYDYEQNRISHAWDVLAIWNTVESTGICVVLNDSNG